MTDARVNKSDISEVLPMGMSRIAIPGLCMACLPDSHASPVSPGFQVNLLASRIIGVSIEQIGHKEKGEAIAGLAFPGQSRAFGINYSTVTDLARFRGLSTSVPRASAVW